jgi:hypothetical protein
MIHYGEVRADAEWVAPWIQGRSRCRRLDRGGEPGGIGQSPLKAKYGFDSRYTVS